MIRRSNGAKRIIILWVIIATHSINIHNAPNKLTIKTPKEISHSIPTPKPIIDIIEIIDEACPSYRFGKCNNSLAV